MSVNEACFEKERARYQRWEFSLEVKGMNDMDQILQKRTTHQELNSTTAAK